ncbi:MAG: peroxiredoxin family protein [Cyclobacteriaceae bacterium]
MKNLIFSMALVLIVTQSYSQTNYNGLYYYKGAAGDTARYMGKNCSLYQKHLGDTLTSKYELKSGLFRLFVHPDINVKNDLEIKIIDEQDREIAATKHDEYLEFSNPSSARLRFIAKTNTILDSDIQTIGRLFWIYSTKVEREAPAFELTDISENTYTNESLLGKIVVINFWGTTCGPCVREIPELNRLVQQYADRDDVVFLAISVDKKEKIESFLERKAFYFQLVSLASEEHKATELQRAFTGDIGLPTNFVINKEGKVVFQFLNESIRIRKMLSQCIDRYLSPS